MRSGKAAALIFSAGSLLLACRPTQRTAGAIARDGGTAGNNVVLVYMGGFNSCASNAPDGLYGMAKFNELKAAIEGTNKTVLPFFSCYNGMSSTDIKYKSGSGAVRSTTWQNTRLSGTRAGPARRASFPRARDRHWPGRRAGSARSRCPARPFCRSRPSHAAFRCGRP